MGAVHLNFWGGDRISESDFIIRHTSHDIILIRKELKLHSHFKSTSGAEKLIKLLINGILPKNRYFYIAAQRVTTEKEFRELKPEYKKPKYINRGVR